MIITVTTFNAKNIKEMNFYTKKLNDAKIAYDVYGSETFTIEAKATEDRVFKALFS